MVFTSCNKRTADTIVSKFMNKENGDAIEQEINIIELCLVILILAMAYVFQFFAHELPCPLCLMQRIGFIGMTFGMILNVRFGIKPIHYGLSILSGLFTVLVAGRQILLHIDPGSSTYGSAFLGLHLYTWSLIAAFGMIFLNVAMLIFHDQFNKLTIKHAQLIRFITHAVFIIVIVFVALNVVTTLMECGLSQCPENPVMYQY